MKGKIRCRICGIDIDRSACGQKLAVVTTYDDSKNDPKQYRVQRAYLCESCTATLEVFINTEILKKVGVVS